MLGNALILEAKASASDLWLKLEYGLLRPVPDQVLGQLEQTA